MRNRWYETGTGRFLSEDPIGLAGGINVYSFAASDPVNGVDPYGLCDEPGLVYDPKIPCLPEVTVTASPDRFPGWPGWKHFDPTRPSDGPLGPGRGKRKPSPAATTTDRKPPSCNQLFGQFLKNAAFDAIVIGSGAIVVRVAAISFEAFVVSKSFDVAFRGGFGFMAFMEGLKARSWWDLIGSMPVVPGWQSSVAFGRWAITCIE